MPPPRSPEEDVVPVPVPPPRPPGANTLAAACAAACAPAVDTADAKAVSEANALAALGAAPLVEPPPAPPPVPPGCAELPSALLRRGDCGDTCTHEEGRGSVNRLLVLSSFTLPCKPAAHTAAGPLVHPGALLRPGPPAPPLSRPHSPGPLARPWALRAPAAC